MKWPSEQIEIVRKGFLQFLASPDCSIVDIRADLDDDASRIWSVFYHVAYDLQYNDTHPAYSIGLRDDGTIRLARIRRCDHNPLFVLYPAGCDDSHLKTMLNDVARSVGLI